MFLKLTAEDEYMAFGLSGSDEKSQMDGADVTIAYMDGARGFATDYSISAYAPVNPETLSFLLKNDWKINK